VKANGFYGYFIITSTTASYSSNAIVVAKQVKTHNVALVKKHRLCYIEK